MPIINVTSDINKVVGGMCGQYIEQIPFAASVGINKTAQFVANEIVKRLPTVFDRPTPYTLKAFKVLKRSQKSELTAIVGLRTDAPGKGQSFERSLAHELTGGNRQWRRFESALFRIGVLPSGMAAVPPRDSSWAVQLDQYGNIPPSVIVVILSYFQAFGEQGYRANSTAKTRARRAKFGTSQSGYRVINGVVYFVSTGKDNTRQLAPGIWAKRGTHGADVAPVLLFVRQPKYKVRLDLKPIAEKTVKEHFVDEFTKALDGAIKTAK